MFPLPSSAWLDGFPTLEFPVAEFVCLALAFVAGATVGSFVNVVVHRAPLGRSVVTGRSHCPACGRAVRWHDNIPILNWLVLRGRCRDCGAAISPRYPLVEAAGGGLSMLVAAAVLFGMGGLAGGGGPPAIDRLLLHGDGQPILYWMHRTATLLAVLAWSLLAAAGHRVSRTTVLTVSLVVGLSAALVPGLEPWSLGMAGGPAPAAGRCRPLVAVVGGAAAGWCGGTLLGRPGVRSAAILMGAGWGWQAAVATLLVEAAGRGLGRLAAKVSQAANSHKSHDRAG